MRSLLAAVACILSFTGFGFCQDPYSSFVASTNPRTPAQEQICFHLPPGFEIELVAAEPDIIKPINMNFDDRGRLWVTQSVEYPFPAPADRKGRDTVKIFQIDPATGKATKTTTFVDGLSIPVGLLPVAHGAIVYSIPNIYRFTDTNGDDHADRQEVLYGKIGYPTLRDTHGMTSGFTWGFDGWVYACHGFSNDSDLRGKDGSELHMNSGNTYRMRADGSHIEQFTHGQVNPFGLCFDPLGNLYSADCHTKPIMLLQKDGYYQSFGKPHDGLGFAPEICGEYDRSTAVSGIVYYAADQFPKEYRGTVFFGDVVVNQVNQYHLHWHGSTPQTVLEPKFLTCDDPWFRPVDLKLGLDGALYVADFYNRIIGHYEVPLTHPGRDHTRGRIWRIVYRGTEHQQARPPRPDWTKATVAELIDDLQHPNFVIRTKAANQLVDRRLDEVLPALQRLMQSHSNPLQRVHALWVLERLHALDDPTLEAAARDSDRGVRVHAMRVLAERRDLPEDLRRLALAGLKDSDGMVQRTAADALGAHPSPANMAPLLALRHVVPADDAQLVYAVRKAIRDQLRPAEVWDKLPVASWSPADTSAMAEVCVGVHSAPAAGFLVSYLQRRPEKPEDLVRYVHHIARYGTADADKRLLAFVRDARSGTLADRAAFLKAMQQGTQERGSKLTSPAMQWAQELIRQLLTSTDPKTLTVGIEQAGALQLASLQDKLVALAENKNLAEAERKSAVDAFMAIKPLGHFVLLGALLRDPSGPLDFRQHVAHHLAGTNTPEGYAELIEALKVAPGPLQNAIAAAMARNREGAVRLLDAVAAGTASPRLLQEWGVHIQLAKHAEFKDRLAKLTQGLPPADKRLQDLLEQRRKGYLATRTSSDVGARIFEKNCAICHQLAGKGTKIGPQLDGIGIRGIDRLLEDIIDPNRNVDQAFRATTLALKNGQVVSGLVLRTEGEVVVVADSQGKEQRVPKSTIEERTTSQLSPMPANLVDQIPEADFYNLLAFLLSQRAPQTAAKTGSASPR
jgi:putative heme-binding domain-containing protein